MLYVVLGVVRGWGSVSVFVIDEHSCTYHVLDRSHDHEVTIVLYSQFILDPVKPFTANVDLSGQRVIVTGGNKGIGLAVAEKFLKLGASVELACRSAERAQAAIKTLKRKTGSQKVTFRKLDLASLKSVRSFATEIASSGNRYNILVNNAGMMPSKAKTADGFDLQLQVNYLGHFLLTHLLIERQCLVDDARVVHVSSQVHEKGNC